MMIKFVYNLLPRKKAAGCSLKAAFRCGINAEKKKKLYL